MKKYEVEKEKLEEAYSVACPNTRAVLLALFGKEAVMPEPDYSDYHNIKTMDDVFAATGCNEEEFRNKLEGLPEDVQAFMLLRLIRKALNPKWKPNWADANECKYYPWFKIQGEKIPADVTRGVWCLTSDAVTSGVSANYVGTLASENREIAIWFGEVFADIWKVFLLPNI